MGLVKYTAVEEILDIRSAPNRLEYEYGDAANEGLNKFAALDEGVREKDGYLYVKARAISSRVNKNNDGWPSSELKEAYSTFLGRPVFVDHNNDDPKRTRGVIVSSQLHEEDPEKTSALDPYYATAPDNHKPPTWIELLIEVDAETFPRLAKNIKKGDIDAVSMGANIDRSVCSVCANEATTPSEYCSHIKQKGLTFEITADNGEKVRKKSYEDCYGVNFFEISFVFDPADTTALITDKVGKTASEVINLDKKEAAGQTQRIHQDMGRVFEYQAIQQQIASLSDAELNDAYMAIAKLPAERDNNVQHNVILAEMEKRGLWNERKNFQWEGKTAGITFVKTAMDPRDLMEPIGAPSEPEHDRNYEPQSEQTTAPQHVDTLRDENVCPVCHASSMETDPDGILRCPVCGHVQPPEPFDNPDLSLAQETDLRQDNSDQRSIDGNPEVSVDDGSNPTRGVTFEPVAPVAAIKANTANGVMSDMFEVKLRTSSKVEADALVPVTAGRVETTLGTDHGIHAGVYRAIAAAGLSAKVTYAGLNSVLKNGAATNVPSDNPIMNFLMAQDAAMHGKTAVKDVQVIIEADSQAEAEKVAELIVSTPYEGRSAAKQPILPNTRQPSDVPAEKVVGDQLKPVEAEAKKVGDVVTVDGKDYRLAPLDEEEKEEKVDTLVDEVVEAEENKDKKKDDEEDKDDDKESRLLHSFKVADEFVALGLLPAEDKMAFIADLEQETVEALEAREKTLATVKQAGFTRKTETKKVAGVERLPRLAHHIAVPKNNGTLDLTPDEAIFL